jgi:2',3'-cyclic-nucleotide 2'-phosphodiesterase / 3'-nucleotidase / 5'-nucleotidase
MKHAMLAKGLLPLVLAALVWGCSDSDSDYFLLSVETDGGGRVVSDPSGIDCGDDCTDFFRGGRQVTLTAVPDPGMIFAGWSGDCTGTGECVVSMDGERSVTAAFSDEIPGFMTLLGTYETGEFDEGAAEINAYDPVTRRLFVVNGADNAIDVLDISNPSNPALITQFDITAYGKGVNSVAFSDGLLAAAVEAENTEDNGRILLLNAEGNVIADFEAGVLPDMVTFTPDGMTLLSANEGEPDDDYTVDPEGSVTIVDLSAGVENASAVTVGFLDFNAREAELRQAGVRIYGPGATVAQDLEPEYIAVSEDSSTAYVVLQENNAVAVLDINLQTITDILPLGYKVQNTGPNGMDASDEDGIINIRQWPVFGMYQPDGLAVMTVGNSTYLLTANEGDSRDYDGFSEEARVSDLVLDETAFPNAAELQDESALGRLKVTTTRGDTDGDGDFDELYAYGGRSFSIWEVTDSGISLVYDSGDGFEKILASRYPDHLNASNDDNAFDDRSDDKGPEPEGITLGILNGRTLAFIGLERMGGVMIYDVSDPLNPLFVEYVNNRDFIGDPEAGGAGDLGPEGLQFIPGADSPTGRAMLAVSNEVSGTTSLYSLGDSVPEPEVVLQVLHASDLEGGVEAIDRAGEFAALVDRFEEMYPNTLVISAGDNYLSGPFNSAAGDRSLRDVFRRVLNNPDAREGSGRADIAIMNLIGFDASAFGNHEFDLGTAFIEGVIAPDIRDGAETRWLGTQFPYLSANLDFSSDENLSGYVTDETLAVTAFQSPLFQPAEAADAPKIADSAVAVFNGERFGIVGGTTPRLASISSPGDTRVKEPGAGANDMAAFAAVLQPVIDDLLVRGIDKIILTTHLQQIDLEKDLITRLRGVDIVIAGGSDTLLADDEDVSRGLQPGDVAADTYPLVTANADGDPAVIVSTDGQYQYVGRLVVAFGPDGRINPDSIDPAVSGAFAATEVQAAGIWGDGDPFQIGTRGHDVRTLTEAVRGIVIQKDSVIHGRTSVYLNGRREDVRTQETNLGNLTADANLAAAQAVDPSVQVSIKNGGGIREPIGATIETAPGVYEPVPPQANPASGKAAGEISELDIENSLRFNNSLTLLTLTAAELLAVIDHGVAATEEGDTPGQFPQVGGLAFSFDPALEPGSRVNSLAILDENGNTVDVIAQSGAVVGDPDRETRVVTLNFLAGGGDGYPFDTLGENVLETEIGEQSALADYLAANYSTTSFVEADTPPESDTRIQNLLYRSDTVGGDVTTFAVFSDPHFFAPELGASGSAFENYLARDRKMLREGPAILDAVVADIMSSGEIDFVIIPGDLTKDGERISHEKFADRIDILKNAGIEVYVVPGNHDINIPHAFTYTGDTAVRTETITPPEFVQIYAEYGYDQALARDPDSLSYIAEPVPGLWLFALDSADYEDNEILDKAVTGGGFSPETLDWITARLAEAEDLGKQVMAFMHHGLLEHYTGQAAEGSLAEDYVIRDWETVSRTLARAGLGVVFTGHFHAQDITRKSWDENGAMIRLTDVETGSLVTYPTPYRVVTLNPNGDLDITSRRITDIDYDTGGVPFPDYAEAYLSEGLTAQYIALLAMPPEQGGFGLPEAQAQVVGAQIAEALQAHYAGDESPNLGTLEAIQVYLQSDDPNIQLIGQNLMSLWTDLAPGDDAGQISLVSGGTGVPEEPVPTYAAFAPVAHVTLPGGNAAEIAAASADGNYLFYTDAGSGQIGVVDITNPAGAFQVDAVDLETGGAAEPTSIAVSPDVRYAFVAVRRGDDAENPEPGVVQVFDISVPTNILYLDQIGVGIGPDSIAASDTPTADGNQLQLVVAIEDEETDAEGDATLGGHRPGAIQVIKFNAASPAASVVTTIRDDLVTALNMTVGAHYPDDPQPEYVAISPDRTRAAVTLQENNAVAVVDISNPDLVMLDSVFSTGAVERDASADLTDDGEIRLTETMTGRREADGITFVPSGNYLVTANEGDTGFDQFGNGEYAGGRGFTIFNLEGGEVFDPLAAVEEQAVIHGHYPDERSEKRGIEVEAVAAATFGADDFLFAASERGSFLAVYRVNSGELPELVQFLPTGTAPEGVLPITGRDDGRMLLVTANEDDGTLNIFEAVETAYIPSADEPMLVSGSIDIPWGALSGLTSDGTDLYAVPDNAFARSRIYRIRLDSAVGQARIEEAVFIQDENMAVLEIDPEGIAFTGNGFWIASEGSTPGGNLLYRTDMDGVVQETIPFPESFLDTYSGDMTSHGYEGVDVSGDGRYVYAALQRGFIKGDEYARILRYDTQTGEWITVRYPMEANSDPVLWMGISEITLLDDEGTLLVVERDKGLAATVEIKRVYAVDVNGMTENAVLSKTLVSDLRWDYNVVQEKVEGMAVLEGEVWVVNDNDGAGWTRLINIGAP